VRGAAFVFAILLASSAALADADQLVVLHDGSRFRGTLVELVPSDHVTIKLATGDVKRFAWADIEKTVVVETSEQVASTSPPPPPPGVFVTLDAPSGAVLQRRTGTIVMSGKMNGAAIWSDACSSPCDTTVSPGSYRVAGPHFRGSNDFELPPVGRVRVDAKLGSAGGTLAGAILSTVGGVLTIEAVVDGVLAVAFAISTNAPTNQGAVIWGTVAGVAGGVGIALLVPGIILVASNSSNATVTRIARAAATGVHF
jgi:hypothetical protein